jgi:hypothetical protein
VALRLGHVQPASIDDIRQQIEDLRAQIVAGDIVVPSKPAKA